MAVEFSRISFPTPKAEALKPLLWVIGLTLGPAVASSWGTAPLLVQYGLYAMGAVTWVCFLLAYRHLLLKNPDRLQSETYMTALLGDERRATMIDVTPVANSAPTSAATTTPQPEIAGASPETDEKA